MKITVKDLGTRVNVLAGRAGLVREVTSGQILEPDFSVPATDWGATSRVLHIRPRQLACLCSTPRQERLRLVRTLLKQKPACIVLKGRPVCEELLEGAESARIPILKISNMQKFVRLLAEKLPVRCSLHGVLVQIFGLGTLVIGKCAVGKSEAVLDLVFRGHKLVADDVVIVENVQGKLIGKPVEMGADLLQIRGLGIINVRALYGQSTTLRSSEIGLVVELEEWQKGHQYNLIGIRQQRYRILGTTLPFVKLPVRSGQNMSTLIEAAARNQLLKQRGIFTARELTRRLKKRIAGETICV